MDFIRKVTFLVWFAIVTVILAVYAMFSGTPIHQVSAGVVQMDIVSLLSMLLALTGFGAFVTFLVNALKAFGIVQDATSQNWVVGFNLIGLVLLFVAQVFRPDLVKPADNFLAALAQIGMIVLGLLFPNAISKLAHAVFRGIPIIGTSFTQAYQRKMARLAQTKVGDAPGTAKS